MIMIMMNSSTGNDVYDNDSNDTFDITVINYYDSDKDNTV